MTNLVAVLFSVYKKDNPGHLKLSIDSVLCQSYSNLLLCIGVDGEIGNDLAEVLDSYKENERVRICWFPENRGLTAVLNDLLGIAKETGAGFYARMDADDISKPDRFEKEISFLQTHPEVDVVGGAIEEISFIGEPDGKVIHYPLTHKECFDFFATRDPFAHPAVMFRASFFEKVPSYRQGMRKNQDTALWYDALKAGCVFANIPDVVLSFRVSENMYKRRGGTSFAKDILQLRLEINKGLGYGIKAWVFAYCYYIMAISPVFVKRMAYKLFR